MEALGMVIAKNMKRQSSSAENRMWQRLRCNIESCCFSLENRWACRIVDLSERGIGIVIASSMKAGTVVNFTDPETRAQVIWSEDNKAGLKVLHS
jgi:hypothetical protein